MNWLNKASSSFKRLQLFATIVFLGVLTACGGGGFDDPVDPGGDSDTVTISMAISSASVDAATPATITATVSNTTGVMSGVVVTFTTTLGVLDPLSGTALTDAAGQATIQVYAGTVEGAGEVIATVGETDSSPIGFTSAGDGSDVAGKVIVISAPSSNVTGAAPLSLTAKVTDNGENVSGDVITFTTTLGVLNPVSGTALTDQNGEASIVLAAGVVEGAGLVTAVTSTGDRDTFGFATDGTGSEAGGNSLTITSFTNSTAIDIANSGVVTIHFEEADGTDLANQLITFTSTLGVLDPETGTALTNATGDATITLAAGSTKGAGILTATSTTGDAVSQAFYTEGNGADTVINLLTISSFTNSTAISNANSAVITVHFEEADGTDLANQVISFTSTLGVLTPATGTALTNATGDATITLAAGTVEGAGVLTATSSSGDVVNQGFYTLGDGSDIGGNSLTISSFTNSTSITNANSAVITVHFEEADGTDLANQVISFTTTLGVLTPQTGTALTNASGDATISLAAGTVEGAGVLTATSNAGDVVSQGFYTVGDGSDVGGNSLTISSFTNSTAITNANSGVITVHFEEADGTDLANQVISFTTTLGVLTPQTGTALTNATGDATISLAAGTVEGAGVLTATSTAGDVVSQGFYTAGDGSDVGGNSLTISSFTNSTAITNANSGVITVHFEEADGTDLANQVISFTTTLGVLTPQTGTALTNATGDATITLAAGTVEGAGVLTATSTAGDVISQGFYTAGDGSDVGGNSLTISSFTNSTAITNANPAAITVHFEEADGTDLANQVISFTTTLGVLDPVTGTALTNATGDATITLAAGTVEGAGVLTATSGAGDVISQGFYTSGDGSDGSGNLLTISSFTNSTAITNANSAVITVHFEEADGTDLANQVISFTSTLGVLDPVTGTALTNATGDATITLAAGTVEGAGVLTATSGAGDAVSQGFYTSGDGSDGSGNLLTISSFTNSTAISNANSGVVTVHFEEADGTDLANQVISFTTTLGVLDPVTGTALTNATGDATITLAAGTVEGAGVLTATSSAGDVVSQGFFTVGDGTVTAEKSLTITSFTNQTSIADGSAGSITVHYELADGTDLANEVITFTSTLGQLTPGTGTVLTNATGDVTITLAAGTVQGAGVLTAVSSSGEAVTAGFFTQGDGASPAVKALTITAFTNQTSISNANPASITVHFEDADGTDLANEVITFTTTIGQLSPAIGTVLTNGTGDATITLAAGSVQGAGVLTATSNSGEAVTAGFFTQGDGVGSGINISIVLTDSGGTVVDQISSISPGTLTATVTGVTKAVIVSFTTDIGTIPVATAIATTASGYVATVDLLAGNALGAGTVTATLVGGESAQLVFSIGASSLGIGNALVAGVPDGLIGVPGAAISAGATAGMSTSIWDISTNPATLFTTETVEVNFSSGCSTLTTPTATIDSPVATVAGVANSTYLAQGCEGADIVTATANAGGTVLSASGTITVNSAATGSIEFVSATPENISLQGVGGTESSTVVFRVLDTNGNPDPNVLVDFGLNTTVGGIVINPSSATTNSDGEVQTVVNSGSVHTTVRVRAEVNGSDPLIFTQSNLLVVSTGIPDQDSFSLSASALNPEGWNIDGTEVNITARLADAFNNPAPDGTAVSFTTEGGAIDDSCVTTDGVCTVIWKSQNTRPDGQVLGQANDETTVVFGTIDISEGTDYTSDTISFDVTADGATDSITIVTATYSTKDALLTAVNAQLVNTSVVAGSGYRNMFELIATSDYDITVTDTSGGSVKTGDILGIADGVYYYNDATQLVSSVNIATGKDFSVNDIAFDVTTSDGTDTVTLNANYGSTAAILAQVNTDLATSSVVATEYQYAGASYLVLTSNTRLSIQIANGAGTSTTLAELGFSDGTTFPTRVNRTAPQTDNTMRQKFGGRATVVATAIGEESFPDSNGNGKFDEGDQTAFLSTDINGEPFDLDEAFVDDNEDSIFNPDIANGERGGDLEKFVDFDVDGVFDTKDSQYNGSLCGYALAGSPTVNPNCSTNKSINIRRSVVLVMSGSNPRFVTTTPANGGQLNIVSDGTAAASVIISDLHNQPMPAGTTVTFTAAVGSVTAPSSYIWPSTNKNGGTAFGVTVKGEENKTQSGPLTVTVTTPGGFITTYTVATISITP